MEGELDMIKEILKENKNSITNLGLKYSVLNHYVNDKQSVKSIHMLTLNDGTKCCIREQTKEKSDADILQNILYKYLRFDAPDYMPIDFENGTTGMLRTDLSRDEKSLFNTLVNSFLKIRQEDLIDTTILARDYHKKMNESLYIPDLKIAKNIDENDKIRNFFLEKQIKRIRETEPGKRPVDAIFVNNHNRIIDFFSDKALEQLTVSRFVKLATFDANNDLSTALYDLNNNVEVLRIIPQSSGVSPKQILDVKKGKIIKKYQSEFSEKPLNLEDTVGEINSSVNNRRGVGLKKELSLIKRDFKIINLEDRVNQFEESTRYKVDKNYVSLVKSQMKEISDMIL